MEGAYVVLKEGEAIFASRMQEIAEAYAKNENERSINQIYEEREEDPEDADIGRIAFMAGRDEQPAEAYKINLSEYVEGDTIEFVDGSEIQYDYICDLIEESKHICTFEQLNDYFDEDYNDFEDDGDFEDYNDFEDDGDFEDYNDFEDDEDYEDHNDFEDDEDYEDHGTDDDENTDGEAGWED